MGRGKEKHWLRHNRRHPPRKMPAEVWNVAGIDQHGESINFDEERSGDAFAHADRLNRLGGNVRVRRMVWNGPAAAYRVPKEDATNG
jgi:hypothetical protein